MTIDKVDDKVETLRINTLGNVGAGGTTNPTKVLYLKPSTTSTSTTVEPWVRSFVECDHK